MFSKIESAIRQASIDRQKDDLAVLKSLKSDILAESKVRLIDTPTDDICRQIIQRHIKQYREAIDIYSRLDQEDRVEAKRRQLSVIEALLPPQLSAEELALVVAEEIEAIQDVESVSLGGVIAQVKARVGEQSSPGEIAQAVKKQLGAKSK